MAGSARRLEAKGALRSNRGRRPLVVASLGARTGTLNWRTALPPNEKRRMRPLTDKAVIALSGKCRAWAQAGGALLWEQPALPGVSAQALAVVEANKRCTVAAGGETAWPSGTVYRCGKRRVVRRARRGRAVGCGVAARRVLGTADALAHKGGVLVAGFVNGKALLASLDVPSGQSVQASSAVLVGRSLSEITLAARAWGPSFTSNVR